MNNHPNLIEDEYFSPHDTAVISVPQKAPEIGTTSEKEMHLLYLKELERFLASGLERTQGWNKHTQCFCYYFY